MAADAAVLLALRRQSSFSHRSLDARRRRPSRSDVLTLPTRRHLADLNGIFGGSCEIARDRVRSCWIVLDRAGSCWI
eukprot:2488488-Prymnesium_polylepis.1